MPEGQAGAEASDEEIRESRAAYYACISFIDAQIGLILDALDRLKLNDNTIVVLCSDHGYLLGEHGGVIDKKTLFEEAVRVPLILAAPQGPKNADTSRIVELVDVYPSLIELCALPEIKDLEGTSFVPLLANADREWKSAAFAFTIKSKRSRFIDPSELLDMFTSSR